MEIQCVSYWNKAQISTLSNLFLTKTLDLKVIILGAVNNVKALPWVFIVMKLSFKPAGLK